VPTTLPATKEASPPSSGAASVDERAWAYQALGVLDEGVIVFDERGRLVYHNAEADKLIGVRALPPEISGWDSVLGIYQPDEKTPFRPDDLPPVRALCGHESRNTAVFVRSAAAPAGVHLLCSSRSIRDATGAVRGAACILRDISERRRDELELRLGERQRKAILDNIPDMAWLKDRDGRFLAVNQPFLDAVAKRTADEVIGLTDADLFPAELAERYRADDAEVMRSGLHKRLEEPFVDATGRRYWIETIKKDIVGDRGQVIGTTGIARDITERKLAEEALRTSNDELERRVHARSVELAEAQESLVRKERLAVLGQLAGGVAHQIRNPLAAIMNAAYVLKRHLQPEQHPNVDDAIRIIHDEVRHANVIITGLLDYARVRTPDRQSTSLVELLERVFSADWIPSNVRITRKLARDVPPIEVDSDQLHGALFNVVRNAVEAMPDGGTLEVDLHLEDDWIVIVVTDSGPGISPQVRAHLFEPLHSTKPMGIGLGLVTARTFVEAHGGRIASLPIPRGARFEIRLPSAS
jgi:PAS domain S-box-containing protein